MRWIILMVTTIFLGACAGPIGPQPTLIVPASSTVAPIDMMQPAATPTIEITRFRADLPDLGEAPELNNEVWLNTDRPVRLPTCAAK